MKRWADLIDIPPQVHKGDFVLKLSEGVQDSERTVRTYVVTPELAEAYDLALTMIRDATDEKRSKAAYLHGSFGSGKSHFMAILNLLLADDKHAKSLEGLTPTVAKHPWIGDKDRKYLMVPYHMVGARDMETAILGGYVDFVRREHPDAPVPGVFVADRILENAQRIREKMGDAPFFEMLNEGTMASAWGRKPWTAETFDEVLTDHDHKKRPELVGDVVGRVWDSTVDGAKAGVNEGLVPLDEGLSIISQHAQKLGYAGLILFLDELILWLASRAGDLDFVHAEGQKLSKLVEAQYADRPIPVISFVARQRDLRDLIGDSFTGAEKLGFSDSLQWWEGRFEVITLVDKNLPTIVSRRLLKLKDKEDQKLIDKSFEEVASRIKTADRDVVMTRTADLSQFREVYPFSPVLVDALVALSSVLQRERTALRLMLTLLVRRRDDLKLGDIIPVGDLWDVVATGDDPFSDVLRQPFKAARRLWENKLRPMLVEELGFEPDEVAEDDERWPRVEAFHTNERLLKTLLLAALVPDVPAFKDMTARRLNALNYGLVQSPISGRELVTVVGNLRRWASKIGELRVGDETDPRVSLQLTDVDIESLIAQVADQDQTGTRKRKVRELLFGWLGIDDSKGLFTEYRLTWRGADRTLRVRYDNVRTMTDDQLRSDDEWTLVLDYPFDEKSFTPLDDKHQLDDFMSRHPEGTKTIAWLPLFVNAAGSNALGRLVCIDFLLARFDEHVAHLAPEERGTVRSMLEGTQSQLHQLMRRTFEVSYGLSRESLDTVDHTHELHEHLVALEHDFTPRLPAGKSFADTLEDIARFAFERSYPRAPKVPDESVSRHLAHKMGDVIRASIESDARRVEVDDRNLRRSLKEIAEPLQLGEMGGTHFAHATRWRDEFERRIASTDVVVVSELREILDPPDARTGMPLVLQDLIIAAFATLEGMTLRRQKVPLEWKFGSVPDDAALVRRELPSEEEWEAAREAAKAVFDYRANQILSVQNVDAFAVEIRDLADGTRGAVSQLPDLLVGAAKKVGIDDDELAELPRYKTGVEAKKLVASVTGEPTELVRSLAAHWPGPDRGAAIARAVQTAPAVVRSLSEPMAWKTFAQVKDREETEATSLMETVREVVSADEHVAGFEKRVRDAYSSAIELLGSSGGGAAAKEHTDIVTVRTIPEVDDLAKTLKTYLEGGTKIVVTWTVEDE